MPVFSIRGTFSIRRKGLAFSPNVLQHWARNVPSLHMALLCGLFLNLVGRHVLPSFDLITQTHRDLQVIRQLEPLLLLINGKGCPALRISLPQKRSDLDLAEVGEFLLTGPLQMHTLDTMHPPKARVRIPSFFALCAFNIFTFQGFHQILGILDYL